MQLRILAGLVFGSLFLGAGSANAAILYEQVPSGTFSVPTVASFDYPTPALKSQAADDFTVPDGQLWTIRSVDVFGLAQAGSSGTDTGNVSVYPDAGTAPGNALFTQNGITLGSGACVVGSPCNPTAPLSNAPPLSPGTYWASVQMAGTYAWWWATYPNIATFGNPAVWKNPAGSFPGHTGCSNFSTLLQCNWTTASDGKDLIFRLVGELVDSRFTLGGLSGHSIKSIGLDATFPGAGKAVLVDAKNAKQSASRSQHPGRTRAASASIAAPEGAGDGKVSNKKKGSVKKVSKSIGSAGTAKLPLKLTKKAKKKLNRGRKVKFKVVVTFTANGGVPYSLTSGKLTLVPR